MVNKGGISELEATNSKQFSKIKPLFVVAKNEYLTYNRAFGSNTMPLGLTKNRFASPRKPKVQKMLEMFSPVTRLRIFAIPSGLAKKAPRPTSMLNSWKL